MDNLKMKTKALDILLTLDNVDEYTQNVARYWVNNNINETGGLMWEILRQHTALVNHFTNVFNSSIENPTIKESLIDEYAAIEKLLWCINFESDGLCEYHINAATFKVNQSKMLKDFEDNGYKVSISMTGVYLVHGYLFKTLKEAYEDFFPNN